MKFLNFSKGIVFTAFLTAATVLNAPAQANSGNNNGSNTVTTATRTVERVVAQDNDTDWGWLGLLGLAGLAGLIPKKRAVEVHDNRTVRDDRTTSDRTTNN